MKNIDPETGAEVLDFGKLAAAAADIDGAATSADQIPGTEAAAPIAPVVIDYTAEAKDLTDFCAGMFLPLYPRLATVWTDEKRAILNQRLGAVLAKHGLSLERLLGQWGPELMLAVCVAPAILPTIQAIKADNAEARAQAQQQSQPQAPAQAAAVAAVATPPGKPAAPPDKAKLHEKA